MDDASLRSAVLLRLDKKATVATKAGRIVVGTITETRLPWFAMIAENSERHVFKIGEIEYIAD